MSDFAEFAAHSHPEALPHPDDRPDAESGTRPEILRTSLEGRPRAEQERRLRAVVAQEVTAVLGGAGKDRPGDLSRPFLELGLDSLTAVELRRRLQGATGLRLPATVVFDHPSTDALARHLRAELFGGPTPRTYRPPPAAPTTSPSPSSA